MEIPSLRDAPRTTDTSAYCQARSRLPETLLQKVFRQTGQNLQEKVTTEYLWCGRNVKVIDGSTVSMPDTIENQKAYPQPKSQTPGCGFPIAKLGVIFSLATGAEEALCIDVLNTHDIKLARNLYQFINPLDILLGDRAFCAYADLISIKSLNCDAVFRKHQARKTTTRKGKIIGSSDKLVTWHKPKKFPQGLSLSDFSALPLTLTVREIYYYIVIPGFRTERVSPITTLLDTTTYPTLKIVELYYQRWQVELNSGSGANRKGRARPGTGSGANRRRFVVFVPLAFNGPRHCGCKNCAHTKGGRPLRSPDRPGAEQNAPHKKLCHHKRDEKSRVAPVPPMPADIPMQHNAGAARETAAARR